VLPLVLVLAACQGGADKGSQTTDGFPAPDKSLVVESAKRALAGQGFVPDSNASNEMSGVIVTRWKLSLQPFASKGYREQATVTIREVPDRPSYWQAEVKVLREINDNMTQPSNPVVADWSDPARAPEVESLIKRRIEMSFLQPDVSDKFRAEHGMPSRPSTRVPHKGEQEPVDPNDWMPAR
jgi:hypothetical protein